MDWLNIDIAALATSILGAAIFSGAAEVIKRVKANHSLIRRLVLNQTAICVGSFKSAQLSTKIASGLTLAASLQLIALYLWGWLTGPDASLPAVAQFFLLVVNAIFTLVVAVHVGSRLLNTVSRGLRRLA